MADEPTETSGNHDADAPADPTPTGVERIKFWWDNSWSGLVKALVVSVALHLLLALPVVFHPALPGDFEFEWIGEMDDLSAIGHGSATFDDDREVDFDDMADFRDAAEQQQEDEQPDDQPDEPDEQPDEPDEEPEPDEQPDEPEAQPDEEADDEEGPDGIEEQATVRRRDDAEQQDEAQDDPEPTVEPAEYVDEEGIPGIEKTGPSNLPDMRDYGPGNARVTSLVRTDRMRGTDFEPYVDDLIRAIPDYRIALDGTDFDPVDELDSFFMATARPEYVQETFLAARHRFDDEELKRTLDRRFDDEMPWETEEGRPVRQLVPDSLNYRDPRRLLLAEPGLALIGQPHWFEELMGPVDEDSDLGRELADADGGPSAFTLLDGLSRIEETVDDDEDLLMLVSAYGARIPEVTGLGVDLSDLPVFYAAKMAISDPTSPRVTIDLRLRNEETARELNERCPSIARSLGRSFLLRAMDLARYFEHLECRQEGEYVVVEAQYEAEEVRRLLSRLPDLIRAGEPTQIRNLPRGPEAEDDPDDQLDEEVEDFQDLIDTEEVDDDETDDEE